MRQTSMRHKKWLERRRAIVVLALVGGSSFGVLRARDASSEPMATDGAPSGMVAFVGGGVCPPGWVHVSELEGRAIVGTITKEDVGIDVGTPFGDREERVHLHKYTGAVTLAVKGIATLNGPNGSVAAAGTYSVAGSTMENDAGLPFFQMEGCIKP
jgi:hypothetical protein